MSSHSESPTKSGQEQEQSKDYSFDANIEHNDLKQDSQNLCQEHEHGHEHRIHDSKFENGQTVFEAKRRVYYCLTQRRKIAPIHDIALETNVPMSDSELEKNVIDGFSSAKIVEQVLADFAKRRESSKKFACCSMIHPYSAFSKYWAISSLILMSYIAVMVPVILSHHF